MMRWIVNWSATFRKLVIALTVFLAVATFLQLDDVNKDILPEFSPTVVEVQTEALGLSAAEVEQLITVPLEQDLLNGVAFLEKLESVSLPGLSSVVMTFESGTDLLDARQVVAERLTQAGGLPQVADPPQMIQPLSSTSRVVMASLRSTELTPIEMSVLARWVMVPRLLAVEGVANVAIWGFRDQQLQVLVDPARLAQENVTLNQVISTAGNALEFSPLSFLKASSPGTGGFIDTVNQRLHVFHEQAITSPEQLAQVTIEGIEGGAVFVAGEPLTLGDVSELVTDHQPLIGDALCAAGPCILLVIEKFPGADTPVVTAGVDEALEALRLGLPGMEIDASVYRPAAYIDTAVDNLSSILLVGALVAFLVLAVLFFNWRTTLISTVSILASLAVAVWALLLLGVTVNAMVFAGIVAALVVTIDDAVMAANGAVSADDQRGYMDRVPVIPGMVESVLRLRSVSLYATAIVAAATLPVIAMEREGGAFLEPIALSFLLAIAATIVVSLTVTPALSVLLWAGESGGDEEPEPTTRPGNWDRRVAPRTVPKIGRAAAIFGLVIVIGLVAASFLTPSLRPSLKERDVLIHLEAAPGTSLARMDTITAEMIGDLSGQPGVTNVGGHVGRAIMSDQIVNVNSAEIWLNIDEAADYTATIERIESVVDSQADIVGDVTTYSSQRVTEILGERDDEVVVRIYGENSDTRQSLAGQVQAVMATVDGIEDPTIAIPPEETAIEIEVDLESAQAFGVKPGDVRRQAAILVSGLVVGNLFEDQKVFDVVVWGEPGIRDTVEDVQLLPIATPSGDQVPLGEVASVRLVPNPSVIRHDSSASYTDVAAAVSGRSLGGAAADVDEALAAISFPLEHHPEVLGGFADERAAQSRVNAAGVAALILIYLLFQAAFSSWRLATLAFLAVPLAITGSLVAILLTGGELTLGSVTGIVAVFGLATRWVVLLIKSYQRRERRGEPFGSELIVAETARLVVPMVISAITIAGLFLPLAVTGSSVGVEIVGPAAVAILGGLVTTMLLVLTVLPSAYLQWGYIAEPDTSADDLFVPREFVTADPTATTLGDSP